MIHSHHMYPKLREFGIQTTRFAYPHENQRAIVSLMLELKQLSMRRQLDVLQMILAEMNHYNNGKADSFYYDVLRTVQDLSNDIDYNRNYPTLSNINQQYQHMYEVFDPRDYKKTYLKYLRDEQEEYKANRFHFYEENVNNFLAMPDFATGDEFHINISCEWGAGWLVSGGKAYVLGQTGFGYLLDVQALRDVQEYNPKLKRDFTYSNLYMMEYCYPKEWIF